MSKTSRHTKGSQFARPTVKFVVSASAFLTGVPTFLAMWDSNHTIGALVWIITMMAALELYSLIFPFVARIVFLNRTSQDVEKKAEPPIIAEFLVGLCTKRRYRNGLLQNLEDDFESNLAAGATVRRARRKYWSAALHSIGPLVLAWAKRIGIIGIIADYARRLLH